MIPTAAELTATAERIKDYIHRTPVLTCSALDDISGAQLFFKCENFQKMGAFKMRGALNCMLQLSNEERARGVVTHSSGNFAQAVALGAKMLGIKAWIVMPGNAPAVKKRAVLGCGAEVIDCEPTLAARESTAAEVEQREGATFLHAYDSYRVIAGQATAAMELLEDHPDLEVLFAPIGGGGLSAGTCLAGHYFGNGVKTYGGEPAGADDAYLSLQKGEIIPQTSPDTIADGLRTSLGKAGFSVLSQHLEEVITVSEEEIIEAMRLIWERMKIIVEPSSAVPFAALLKENERFIGQKAGIIISGGNVDLGQLPF